MHIPPDHRFGLPPKQENHDMTETLKHPHSTTEITGKISNIPVIHDEIVKVRTAKTFGAPSVLHKQGDFLKKLDDRKVHLPMHLIISCTVI